MPDRAISVPQATQIAQATKRQLTELNGRLDALGGGVPTSVRQAIYTLLNTAAYVDTGLTDEIAVIEAWASIVTAISLNTSTASISGSGTTQLVATTVPANSAVTWSSSDTSVATVNNAGIVTGVSNGTAVITAASGDLSAKCTVTVSGFATLSSISAVYTQGGTVYDIDTLESLKANLVVTGTYTDSTTETITNYVLSGTLTAGTSTITVYYGGETTTFTVTVTSSVLYSVFNRTFNKTDACEDTEVQLMSTDRDFTILMDGTQENAIPTGTSIRLLFCGTRASNWKGIFFGAGSSASNTFYGIQWLGADTGNMGFLRTDSNVNFKLAYRHVAGTNKADVFLKINSGTVSTKTLTSNYVANAGNLFIGGGDTSQPESNWVGTMHSCKVHSLALSDDYISNFMAS